jgi:hypothetical protein
MHSQPKWAAPLAAFVLIGVVGLAVILAWPAISLKQQQRETTELVLKWSIKLAGDKVESGEYRRFAGPVLHAEKTETTDTALIVLPENDSWGGELVTLYIRDDASETVKVVSRGPDGELGTDDDIVRGATTGLRKAIKQVAKDTVRETGKQWAIGLGEGIRESFKKKPDAKNGATPK